MTNKSKDIELVIRTTDLSSKPLDQIGDAVTKLEKAVSDLGPAAQRGEIKLGELQRVALKLEQALKGLAANQAVIERFNQLNATIDQGKSQLAEYALRVDQAQKALAGAAAPTKELTAALKAAERDFQRQEKELGKLTGQLDRLSVSAKKAGIDVTDLSAAQASIDGTLARTTAAYGAINAEIDEFDANQRKAIATSKAVAEAQAHAAQQTANAQALTEFRNAQDAKAQAGAAAFEHDRQEIARLNAEAVKLRQSAEYVQFWTTTLDAAEKQAKDTAAFQKLGQEAEASAKSFGRARVEVDQLATANKTAGASVRAIINPEQELIKTLNGMEASVDRGVAAQKQFATEMQRTGRSAVDLNAELDQLGKVQSSAAGVAALIDRFRNTRSAAAAAASEMRNAKAEVLQYARAVQQADQPNKQLADSLALAQQRLEAAEKRYQSFAAAAQKLRGDLGSAGVNMRNLANEMARVESVARSATAATNSMATSIEKTGAAASKGATGFNLFTAGGRTTLSLTQRLRGEVLALTATYVGLYGAISGVDSVLKAVQQRSATNARLSVAFGGDQAGKEMAYVREQAERLGLSLPSLADQYSKLAVGATAAGLSLRDTRFVFESFAEVGKVFNLTEENIDGVFKALEQIFSKGTVQAEELRGQLGDRLTGAFFNFAKALHLTSGDLNDWLKDGKITSEFVLLFAEEMRNKVAPQLAAATQTSASELARFGTALNDLKLAVADSGFLEAFTKAVRKLTAYFKSSEGAEFADKLGKGLTALANLFIFLMDNIESLKKVVIALGVTWATVFAGRMVVDIVNTAMEFKKFATLVTTESPRLAAALGTIGGALAAGFAGFQLGTWLNDNFAAVRKFGVWLVTFLDSTWKQIVGDAKLTVMSISWLWEREFTALYNISARVLKQLLELLSEFARKVGLGDLADSLAKKASDITLRQMQTWSERTATLRKQIEDEQKAIAAIRDQMLKDAETDPRKASAKAAAAPGAPATIEPTTLDASRRAEIEKQLADMVGQLSAKELQARESAAKKRIALAEQVADELARIEQGITKRGAETLEERLAVIDTQYRELINKIKELGGTEGAGAKAKLDELILLRKQEETQKFNDDQRKKRIEEIKDAEQAINDRVQVRDAMIAAENAKRKAGLITEAEARSNIAQITLDTNATIKESAANTIAMIDALKDPEAQAALAGVRANMEAISARAIEIPDALISAAQVNDQWADGLTGVADEFARAAAESGSLSDGIQAAGRAFQAFAADFLRQIATMILKQIILNALSAMPGGGAFAGAANALAGKNHVGSQVGKTRNHSVSVDPRIFASAPRYHGGGMVGLRSDEVPAILQTGEEVLSRNDPRNAKNAGKGGSGVSFKIVNTFDAESAAAHMLSTKTGEEMVMNIIRANKEAF